MRVNGKWSYSRRDAIRLGLGFVAASRGLKGQGRGKPFRLSLSSRVQPFKGIDEWREVHIERAFQAHQSAIVICDMWDKHWCRGATDRVNRLVQRMEPLLKAAREAGFLIIHAPSDTMDFYREFEQRKAILALKPVDPPQPLTLSDPPLPIDDRDGGCDTPGDQAYKAWSRQHPGLTIGPSDLISDNGREIFSALKLRGIKDLFVCGVHTNMCILNRTFAIRQMSRWGVPCVLIRDLTDAMYDPKDPPYVSHEAGTQLVIEHIEKYWAPTVTSRQILEALAVSHT